MAIVESVRPGRDDVDESRTWDLASIYRSERAWEDAFAQVERELEALRGFAGRLGESGALLYEFLDRRDQARSAGERVWTHPALEFSADTAREDSAGREQRSVALRARVDAAVAFAEPELLSLGDARLAELRAEEPRLERYDHYFDRVRRRAAHLRSAEVEDLLAVVCEPFASARFTGELLADAELSFQPATGADGGSAEVAAATFESLMLRPDRELRRSAWHRYTDGYLGVRATLANALVTVAKQNVFNARARRYGSALEATLAPNAIPVEVYHSVVEAFRRNLPIWHRYWRVRQKALGLDVLAPYDLQVPLSHGQTRIPYEQALDWVVASVAPLGAEYVDTLRHGALHDRWIDVYPTRGKRPGAFSAGTAGTKPFICLNYTDDLRSASILAHELGHSMHSRLSWDSQPLIYTGYSTFVAEVASNLNQALMRAHLLAQDPEPELAIAIIDETMGNYYRYFFVMPTLARLELELHDRVERGEAVTASTLIEVVADLFAEGYGGEVQGDRERVGITWAQFPHLMESFYVFQYTTGIAGAAVLSQRVLSGEPGAVEDVLTFLSAGDRGYPIDVLRAAGVDLESAEPIDRTFAVMSSYVDRLEQLLAAR
jgi:oligoendopeptidase F